MIAASGINDVIRMYNTTQRDGIGFNLAYIGSDFTEELPQPFDQGYMRAPCIGVCGWAAKEGIEQADAGRRRA